jgi:hypothetical protein
MERRGVEWVRKASTSDLKTDLLVAQRDRHHLAWTELDHVLGLFSGRSKQIASGDVQPEKSEKVLLTIFVYHGLAPFSPV